ncbi:epoxyqueuosine reductase [Anaerospora hongkongensis]|uniref:epoxyqueuosine reductase n=1 Tax=Anaerospora hongkongensis TaxID=244830 RepID=UPI0028A1DC5E|nr:epoxyqueuosine reductase [Anaerospora hongkongensis]
MQESDVQEIVTTFLETSPLNRVAGWGGIPIYEDPLLGIAAADDRMFGRLKEETAVGPQHCSPQEWLPDAQRVISYFLPFSKKIREANRKQGIAADEWMIGRIQGEVLNNALRDELVNYFTAAGHKAVSPARDGRFVVINRRSSWSERHVAYIAGLGTFSLSRSLITRRGSAGRLGSVIVDCFLEPTPRAYTQYEEYCSKCGACILRCPPLAINEQGKDNAVCSAYLDRVLARYQPKYGCGKCQTGVPCEANIPAIHC